jgi:hypothetical protein
VNALTFEIERATAESIILIGEKGGAQ